MLGVIAGTPDQLLDLIRQAENRDPQAVARLEFLYPQRDDLAEACDLICSKKIPRARLEAIPTVGQLAAEWAMVANRDPDSKNVEDARRQLLLLTSKGSALRSPSDKGRPRIQEHPTAIKEIYEMNYCLFIQVREVRKFLDRNFPYDEGNQSRLLSFYPWLEDVASDDIFSFIRDSASTGAIRKTGADFGISPGKVQQSLYED